MKVKCLAYVHDLRIAFDYSENYARVDEIEEWLKINIGNRFYGWDWFYNSNNDYWYIDIKNEADATMFKLKFGI
jgi:hypothetical protein